jgi:hypothetical protein
MRGEEVKAFLQPIAELDERRFWQHQSEGLAIFRSRDRFGYYCLPLALAEGVFMGDRFHLTPVLPLFNQDGRFYILALSQQQIRLLQGSNDSVDEIDLTGIIPSMTEALRFEALERQISSHMGTPGAVSSRRGSSGGATVFHGHGAGDEDEKEKLRQYFHRVDKELQILLRKDYAPLVLAGVEYLLPIYRAANTYPYLMETGILGNPESLSVEALRNQAWTIVEPYFLQAQADVIAHYTQLAGTPKTSSDIYEILPAADQGRIDSLLVAINQQLWGTYDPDTQTVNVYARAELNTQELLDLAVIQTLLHEGKVYAVNPQKMPNQAPVAAIFRY